MCRASLRTLTMHGNGPLMEPPQRKLGDAVELFSVTSTGTAGAHTQGRMLRPCLAQCVDSAFRQYCEESLSGTSRRTLARTAVIRRHLASTLFAGSK
jgi:hypothetical protein